MRSINFFIPMPSGPEADLLQWTIRMSTSDCLRDEILAWYTDELKSYDDKADAELELFDPGTGTTVEGISELAILEVLSELQIFNKTRRKNMR